MKHAPSFLKRHPAGVALIAVLAAGSVAAFAADSHKTQRQTPPPAKVAQASAAAPATPPAAPPAAALPPVAPVAAPLPPAAPPTADQSSIPSDDRAYNDQVARLEREHYYLLLESQNADLRKKIAESQGDSASLSPPSVIVAPPASMTPQSGVPGAPPHGGVSSITLPDAVPPAASIGDGMRLTSVVGVGGNYQAYMVDHGVDMPVHVGSTLSDGWRVERIAPSSIELTRGRRHRVLHIPD